jgi:hypothetical protein
MSKTTVHILQKNRRIKKIKIKASEGFLEFKNGFYIVSPEAINRISKNGVMASGSEMFFFEGNSSPIPVKAPEEDAKDPSRKYLDDTVYYNFLEQTGAPRSERFKSAMSVIRPIANFSSMFKILMFLLIVGAIARRWFMAFV